ncbi:MAG: nuclear transport factor 2 family protein [Bacteroidota bacterium]|nr:nuclear transport factor 2 family protein [Bacteroidota bacterium]
MEEKIESLFNDIDEMDADKFASYLDDDVSFRFGNAPTVVGKKAVRDAVDGFFKSIKGIAHKKLKMWLHPDSIIYQGIVTYTRHDGSKVTLPYLNLFFLNGEKIKEYLIYMDVNPLFVASVEE